MPSYPAKSFGYFVVLRLLFSHHSKNAQLLLTIPEGEASDVLLRLGAVEDQVLPAVISP